MNKITNNYKGGGGGGGMSYQSGWTCACCSFSWNVKICHSACSRTRSQIPGRKGRGPQSRRRWREAGLGSSALAEEPAADWAPSPPCCRSHPWARPRRTELAATGSLGTGKEAEGENDVHCQRWTKYLQIKIIVCDKFNGSGSVYFHLSTW